MTTLLLFGLLLLLKSLAFFGLSGLALRLLRRGSAAARHLVCLLTLCALLALPLLSAALPSWRVAVIGGPPAPTTLGLGGRRMSAPAVGTEV